MYNPHKQLVGFDLHDPKNVGRPRYFPIQKITELADHYVSCDEIMMALELLKMLPGWYRDNVPEEIVQMRKDILQKVVTIKDYCGDTKEEDIQPDFIHYFENFPRSAGIFYFVKELNKRGIEPSIYEYGPAAFWVVAGLKKLGLKFDYTCVCINANADKKAREEGLVKDPDELKNEYKMYICMEVAEHLWHLEDLEHLYRKHFPQDMDIMYITTPYGACGGGLPNWKEHVLGHLRTFTFSEFAQALQKFFPEVLWSFFSYGTLLAFGARNWDRDKEVIDATFKSIEKVDLYEEKGIRKVSFKG